MFDYTVLGYLLNRFPTEAQLEPFTKLLTSIRIGVHLPYKSIGKSVQLVKTQIVEHFLHV